MGGSAMLTEFAAHGSLTIIRESQFKDLGLLGHLEPGSLVYVADPGLATRLTDPNVAAVITTRAIAPLVPDRLGLAVADRPERAFYAVHERLVATTFYWEDFPTIVGEGARIHERAWVASRGVRIGRGSEIGPNAAIHERVTLGDEVIVRAGAVIGSEGFEYKGPAMRQGRPSRVGRDYEQEVRRVPHGGSVSIGDRVEVGANATVDRSLFRSPTKIGSDTKVDNLVYIAHSVRIGQRTLIVGGSVIAGSVTIGDDVWIGPRATVLPGLTIGDAASVVVGTLVSRSVRAGERVSGDLSIFRLS